MVDNIFGVVLCLDNLGLKNKKAYNLEIYGKALFKWTALAFSGNYVPVEFDESEPIENLPLYIKEHVDKNSEYTVVLYSDTPLLSKNTVSEALSELISSGVNVIRMTRGFIFRTKYLLSIEKIIAPRFFSDGGEDFLTISSLDRFAFVSDILRHRILSHHMKNGVVIYDTATTYIDAEVSIGSGTEIFPDNTLKGSTVLAEDVVLQSGNVITDCKIYSGAEIKNSTLIESKIGQNTKVGPYAYLRPGSIIGNNCRIGDFVEIKKSEIGDNTKVSHLSYIGDAKVGSHVNIGCGVVVANYDGKTKQQTNIGNGVFVGSNSNLIAPLTLNENAFVAAGSTITDDVPPDALAIARARQVIKPDWRK